MSKALTSEAWTPVRKERPKPECFKAPPPSNGTYHLDKVRLLAWFNMRRRAVGLPFWACEHAACLLARYGHIERVPGTDVWAITRAGEEWLKAQAEPEKKGRKR